MLTERIVYINGEFIDWNRATVHLMSHSFARGSAVFEVLSFHKTGFGPAVFRLDEHLRRLFKTVELLDMEIQITAEDLQEAVKNTIKRNGLPEGLIKIVCFYPQIAFDILPPQNQLDVSIFVIDPKQDLDGIDFHFEQGTTVGISKWRKLDVQTVPIEAKVAANYLNGMVARIEAKKRRFENAVMLDTQGFVAEGGTESVFLVRNDRLYTPFLGMILESITRKSILQAAKSSSIETSEERLPPDFLFQADEIFLSNTPYKVIPVRQIENQKFAQTPGPITRKINDLMNKIVSGQEKRFNDWLFFVD
ncbi:MAG: aminotransferase class IV [Desulfobacterales bacterium]|nr:aminotransferase class IV [Desulfobacterales bacterium]MDP6682539.1 aminotransferase class IV [Desulfobacterales bacterium]MDP6807952.1 aminotransferase class IV [Desulfobacterales bacterium]